MLDHLNVSQQELVRIRFHSSMLQHRENTYNGGLCDDATIVTGGMFESATAEVQRLISGPSVEVLCLCLTAEIIRLMLNKTTPFRTRCRVRGHEEPSEDISNVRTSVKRKQLNARKSR
jgi:hypothetical protein